MTETVLATEMTEEQYKLEIADMMVQVQDSNDESTRRRAEIERLKTQSQALMASIEAAVRRRESRGAA